MENILALELTNNLKRIVKMYSQDVSHNQPITKKKKNVRLVKYFFGEKDHHEISIPKLIFLFIHISITKLR